MKRNKLSILLVAVLLFGIFATTAYAQNMVATPAHGLVSPVSSEGSSLPVPNESDEPGDAQQPQGNFELAFYITLSVCTFFFLLSISLALLLFIHYKKLKRTEKYLSIFEKEQEKSLQRPGPRQKNQLGLVVNNLIPVRLENLSYSVRRVMEQQYVDFAYFFDQHPEIAVDKAHLKVTNFVFSGYLIYMLLDQTSEPTLVKQLALQVQEEYYQTQMRFSIGSIKGERKRLDVILNESIVLLDQIWGAESPAEFDAAILLTTERFLETTLLKTEVDAALIKQASIFFEQLIKVYAPELAKYQLTEQLS